MLQDIVIVAMIVAVLVLVWNYECHNSTFYPINFDLTLEDAYLQAYVFSWFWSLGELQSMQSAERAVNKTGFLRKSLPGMLLQAYCVSSWPQQHWESTKKEGREINLQATVWDQGGLEGMAFPCIPIASGKFPEERCLSPSICWNGVRDLL